MFSGWNKNSRENRIDFISLGFFSVNKGAPARQIVLGEYHELFGFRRGIGLYPAILFQGYFHLTLAAKLFYLAISAFHKNIPEAALFKGLISQITIFHETRNFSEISKRPRTRNLVNRDRQGRQSSTHNIKLKRADTPGQLHAKIFKLKN